MHFGEDEETGWGLENESSIHTLRLTHSLSIGASWSALSQTSHHAHEGMRDTVLVCKKCDPFDKKNGLKELKRKKKNREEMGEGGVVEAFQPVLGT